MNIDIKKLREDLESEKATLTEELRGLGRLNLETNRWEATPSVDETLNTEPDPNELADRGEDFEERSSLLAALVSRYSNIERALEKITNNTYGRCEKCEEMIEADRLEANPSARTCKRHME